MGRILACGIGIEIYAIRNSNEEDKNLKDLKKIKEILNGFFNMDDYEIDTEKYSDSFVFTIKKDFLEKNIHETIKEVYKLYKNSNFYYPESSYEPVNKDILQSKEFNQENYPLKLEYVKESKDRYKPVVVEKNGSYLNDVYQFSKPYWLYEPTNYYDKDKKMIGRYGKYYVYIRPACIWGDDYKYDGEDENNMLLALNTMKKSYFKKPLSKDLHFYVLG